MTQDQPISFLDTETTGIGPLHRIVEIGLVQVIDRAIIESLNFQVYLNPDRAVDESAYAVHGLSDDFLSNQPRFESIESDLINRIQGTDLYIHNAAFDVAFLDREWARLGLKTRVESIAQVKDTLAMARVLYPAQKNSLDALCKRFGIDSSHRTLHGALLDAQLLAQVYLAMTSGQEELYFQTAQSTYQSSQHDCYIHRVQISDEDQAKHLGMMAQLEESN